MRAGFLLILLVFHVVLYWFWLMLIGCWLTLFVFHVCLLRFVDFGWIVVGCVLLPILFFFSLCSLVGVWPVLFVNWVLSKLIDCCWIFIDVVGCPLVFFVEFAWFWLDFNWFCLFSIRFFLILMNIGWTRADFFLLVISCVIGFDGVWLDAAWFWFFFHMLFNWFPWMLAGCWLMLCVFHRFFFYWFWWLWVGCELALFVFQLYGFCLVVMGLLLIWVGFYKVCFIDIDEFCLPLCWFRLVFICVLCILDDVWLDVDWFHVFFIRCFYRCAWTLVGFALILLVSRFFFVLMDFAGCWLEFGWCCLFFSVGLFNRCCLGKVGFRLMFFAVSFGSLLMDVDGFWLDLDWFCVFFIGCFVDVDGRCLCVGCVCLFFRPRSFF